MPGPFDAFTKEQVQNAIDAFKLYPETCWCGNVLSTMGCTCDGMAPPRWSPVFILGDWVHNDDEDYRCANERCDRMDCDPGPWCSGWVERGLENVFKPRSVCAGDAGYWVPGPRDVS